MVGALSNSDNVDSMKSNWIRKLKNHIYTIPSSSEEADRKHYQPLLDLIGDSRIVLIGESTHGTSDFYKERQKLTKFLIREQGFAFVAAEADWLDAQRCNCYVRNLNHMTSAKEALSGFQRFPSWMWRNQEVSNFLEWLRGHNTEILQKYESQDMAEHSPEKMVGFYGLDIYSMHASFMEVMRYLKEFHPEIAKETLEKYDSMSSRGAEIFGKSELQELSNGPLVEQLVQLVQEAGNSIIKDLSNGDLHHAADLHFYARQNCRVMENAKEYFRALLLGGQHAWNVREEHMFSTLMDLIKHSENTRPSAMVQPVKVVVWGHNVHMGDSRGMEMGWKGALSLGQLVRERSGLSSISIGFSTYQGKLTTADEWGGIPKSVTLNPAELGSYEEIFHSLNLPRFVLHLASVPFTDPNILQREIGVLYKPDKERSCHYFYATLSNQFDAIIHLDESNSLQPLS